MIGQTIASDTVCCLSAVHFSNGFVLLSSHSISACTFLRLLTVVVKIAMTIRRFFFFFFFFFFCFLLFVFFNRKVPLFFLFLHENICYDFHKTGTLLTRINKILLLLFFVEK